MIQLFTHKYLLLLVVLTYICLVLICERQRKYSTRIKMNSTDSSSSIVTFDNGENIILVSILAKISLGILTGLAILISSLTYLGFIHYEMYGEDAMKRSIKNKLLAQVAQIIIGSVDLLLHFTKVKCDSWT